MKQILPLLILIGYFNQNTTAQNKGAEDFDKIKNYFTIKSSNGPFLELTPTKEGRKKNPNIPKQDCYAVYVEADNYTSAVSEIVVLARRHSLEFRDEVVYFKQKPNEKYAQKGFVIVYKKKTGDIPKDDPVIEFN